MQLSKSFSLSKAVGKGGLLLCCVKAKKVILIANEFVNALTTKPWKFSYKCVFSMPSK